MLKIPSFILVLCLLVMSAASRAQNTVTNISTEVFEENGQKLVLHKVQTGQTLYSIARAYKVPVTDLMYLNPTARQKLEAGQALKVPAKNIESIAPAALDPILEKPQMAEPKKVEQSEPIVAAEVEDAKPKAANLAATSVAPISSAKPKPATTEGDARDGRETSDEASEKKPKHPLNPSSSTLNEYSYFPTLLEKAVDLYFVNYDSVDHFHLKEYFMVETDEAGKIKSINDERTVTNKNTNYLNDLKGFKGEHLGPKSALVALGLEVEADRVRYQAKVKRKKIRIYKEPLFVEYLDEQSPQYDLLMKASKEQGQRGKCTVEFYTGVKKISTFKKFEYNPFGALESTLLETEFCEIETLQFH